VDKAAFREGNLVWGYVSLTGLAGAVPPCFHPL
jgi:hypothetical protein